MSKVVVMNPPPEAFVEKHDRPKYPGLGLGYLGAVLLDAGIGCSTIDSKFEKLTLRRALRRVKEEKPEIVCITSMTHEIDRAHSLAAFLKAENLAGTVIVGGVHATILPEETLRDYPQFDFLVAGEAELVLVEMIGRLLSGKPVDDLPGVGYRAGSKTFVNGRAPVPEDLDRIPFPAWELFPGAGTYAVLTSRGCPYRCTFCSRPYGNRIRERSPENVVSEIVKVIERFHPRKLEIFDETFGFKRKRLDAILDLMIEMDIQNKVQWLAGTALNNLSRPMMEKMRDAGCSELHFGVESGNPEIAKRVGKPIDLEKALQVSRWAKELGLRTESFFILGHPHETMKTAMDTINFAARLNTTSASIGIMTPFPGTKVWEMASHGEGGYRLIAKSWRDFNKQLGKALELENLSRSQMERLQLLGYMKLYLANFRIFGFLAFCFKLRRQAFAFLKNYIGMGPRTGSRRFSSADESGTS